MVQTAVSAALVTVGQRVAVCIDGKQRQGTVQEVNALGYARVAVDLAWMHEWLPVSEITPAPVDELRPVPTTRYPARLHEAVCRRIREALTDAGELVIDSNDAWIFPRWRGETAAEYVRLNDRRVQLRAVNPEAPEADWEYVHDRGLAEFLTNEEFEHDYHTELAAAERHLRLGLPVRTISGFEGVIVAQASGGEQRYEVAWFDRHYWRVRRKFFGRGCFEVIGAAGSAAEAALPA